MLHVARRVRYVLPSLIVGGALLAACGAKVNAPPEAPQAVRRGDEAYRYRDYESAIQHYRAHTDLIAKDEYTARALYKTALSQFHLGRYREAIQSLDDLRKRYPDGRWVQVEALRGDTERALGHSESAVEAWDRGWEVGSDGDRSKLRVRIATVARSMSNSELAEAHEAAKNDDVKQILHDQILKRAKPELNEPMPEFEGGPESEEAATPLPKSPPKTEKQAVAMATTAATPIPTPEAEEETEQPAKVTKQAKAKASKQSKAMEETKPAEEEPAPSAEPPAAAWAVPGAPVAPAPVAAAPASEEKGESSAVSPTTMTKHGKVAVLLPISGLEASTGERALDAVRLLFDSKQLVVRDTNDTPASAVREFNELARDPDVLAVIGPIDDETSGAVAPKAFAKHLPLITLSSADDEARPYVVQAGVPQQQLVHKLLDYAMNRVRLRRFGVMYPDQPTAEAFVASFKTQVVQRGGTVIGADSYNPDAQTLTAGLVHRWRETQNLQALVLPDGARAATTFARFLQREMPDVLLLGVNNWDLLAESDQALSGVVFASAFYPDSDRKAAKDFVARYEHTYGRPPGSIEAESYDAALLVKNALDDGARSRAHMWQELQSTRSLPGATGALTVTPKGVSHEVLVLQLVDGKIVELEVPADDAQALADKR